MYTGDSSCEAPDLHRLLLGYRSSNRDFLHLNVLDPDLLWVLTLIWPTLLGEAGHEDAKWAILDSKDKRYPFELGMVMRWCCDGVATVFRRLLVALAESRAVQKLWGR
jgi:hypothetical protein